MTDNDQLLKKVAEIYQWLDIQIQHHNSLSGSCQVCGECCDFVQFDHKLFVTGPELRYLAENLAPEKLKKMTANRCPYSVNGKCTIYNYRFAGCRIFCCKADPDFQTRLSNSVLEEIKSLCNDLHIPYQYQDLATALNNFTG